jgi:hypothetical protein
LATNPNQTDFKKCFYLNQNNVIVNAKSETLLTYTYRMCNFFPISAPFKNQYFIDNNLLQSYYIYNTVDSSNDSYITSSTFNNSIWLPWVALSPPIDSPNIKYVMKIDDVNLKHTYNMFKFDSSKTYDTNIPASELNFNNLNTLKNIRTAKKYKNSLQTITTLSSYIYKRYPLVSYGTNNDNSSQITDEFPLLSEWLNTTNINYFSNTNELFVFPKTTDDFYFGIRKFVFSTTEANKYDYIDKKDDTLDTLSMQLGYNVLKGQITKTGTTSNPVYTFTETGSIETGIINTNDDSWIKCISCKVSNSSNNNNSSNIQFLKIWIVKDSFKINNADLINHFEGMELECDDVYLAR